ncbi:Maf family protein [Thiothrix subterranea]|uniref:7-methyl-GTP pyrophosphatase n=1 Tax=Thiothrix subterranea TaxID=2735563 RepID=A0AA51MLR5_9GAMM|nr:Maf family nucleotide pyrophosphatase [Thiothrix subterranea]MDQ5768181.1 Maf family nucleotide pyrophosphatase [Thiothrix subterranea]WML85361.1 Maf family nucleotide pyrophosphatase [Thiothrix subterranea]
MTRRLILGSTSPYRRELMQRLAIPFETAAPDIDETRYDGESARDMVLRLSLQKAQAVAAQYPDALIIGSDQCAVLHEQVIGKPGNHDNAVKQLQNASGQTVAFLTGLCLYDSRDGSYQLDVVPFAVDFRELSDAEIDAYLHKDQPYNCAGSFRSESLGITLFKRMHGDDPSALMGLPLIRLSEMLRTVGISLLD